MIGKIKKTKGTHSVPKRKPGGSHSQTHKPSPYIEEPRRVTIPIEIRSFPRNTTTVQILEKPRQWAFRKKQPIIQPTGRKCNMRVCEWYRRKRALRQLTLFNKKEKQRELQERIARERYEIEQKTMEYFKMQEKHNPTTSFNPVPVAKQRLSRYHEKKMERSAKRKSLDRDRKELEKKALEHFQLQEQAKKKSLKQDRRELEKKALEHFQLQEQAKKKSLKQDRRELEKKALEHFKLQEFYKSSAKETAPKPIEKRFKKPKKTKLPKTSYAKPKTKTKSVTEKRIRRYEDLSVRFTNCFYRFCCQLYCYFTCFVIIGLVIIVIL